MKIKIVFDLPNSRVRGAVAKELRGKKSNVDKKSKKIKEPETGDEVKKIKESFWLE